MISVGRVRSVVRAYPLTTDAALAVFAYACTLAAPPPDLGELRRLPSAALLLGGVACLGIVVRRRWPLGALAVAVAGTALTTLVADGRPLLLTATGISLYTVAVRTGRWTALVAWGLTVLTLAAATTFAPPDPGLAAAPDPYLVLLASTTTFVAVGDSVRSRREFVASIEERAERAERSREEEARRRVVEERLRIARELHDVVAHHVAVVSVQAGLAGHLVFQHPQAAYDAVEQVQHASAAILDELGGILSVLRQPDEPNSPDEPAPGLGHIEALVASYAAAGLRVSWSSTGQPRRLTDTVDLVAYRLVQEALTNAHKHGTGVAQVSIAYSRTTVALEVTNPMSPVDSVSQPGTGFGLLGMRERATAVGGALSVGRAAQGGFRVAAILPMQSSGS